MCGEHGKMPLMLDDWKLGRTLSEETVNACMVLVRYAIQVLRIGLNQDQ